MSNRRRLTTSKTLSVLGPKYTSCPDYKKPFFLDCDASDEGIGACLYQLVDGAEPTSLRQEEKLVVRYTSSAYDTAMARRPIYYREAYAITQGLLKNRFYLDSSPFTTTVRTDQSSLRWMKTSRRGPVAGWLVEELGDLDFKIEYIPDPKNVLADALSRFPLVTPTQPSSEGIEAMTCY